MKKTVTPELDLLVYLLVFVSNLTLFALPYATGKELYSPILWVTWLIGSLIFLAIYEKGICRKNVKS